MTLHGLSFDIEDWHQLTSLRVDRVAGEPSPNIHVSIDAILDVCDELTIKATFFVLGMLARARPDIVRAISARGHEIGSHSYGHQLVHSLSADELARDLRDSKALLEDLTGEAVVGYRAPEFSVQRLDHPCFAALAEHGFLYDSSVVPVAGIRYGIAHAPHAPFAMDTPSGRLVELPLATTQLGRRRVPIAGGSSFRVLPTTFVTWAAHRAHARGDSLVFYFHPYEFSKELLYLRGGLGRNRRVVKHLILHNLLTSRVARTLRALGNELSFVPLRELARAAMAVRA